ncbi:hypothetical protein ACJ4V0_15680 [Phreatobacter sp. HK31-P]
MYAKGFQGAVPAGSLQQIARIIDFSAWPEVFVACSGTFRIERALLSKWPGLSIHSNDVSLLSCALAGLALGKPETFTFTGDLAFIEDMGLQRPVERVAALMVALDLGGYVMGKPNRYKESHAAHYRTHFASFVEKTAADLEIATQEMPLASFSPVDWLDHVDAAIARGAGIVTYPPTYKGGFEKQFVWIAANTGWEAPGYRVFDPKDLPAIVDRIQESGVPWCILTDQLLEGRSAVAEFQSGRAKPVYAFAGSTETAFDHKTPVGQPFPYKALDVGALTESTKVAIVPCDGAKVTFLKNVFLKKSIIHAPGMWNALVYLDGMLAGAMVFSLSKYGAKNEVYLMSDFSTTRAGRVAKLIARLATNIAVTSEMERRWLDRYTKVMTTAFSDHPVSMKYRGSYEIGKRTEVNAPEGKFLLNYYSPVRAEPLEATYQWWWKRDGKKAVAAYRNRDQDGGPEVAEAA